MFENVHEVSIVVSALLSVAIGSIWYSPLLFGKYWMQAIGFTDADLEIQQSRLLKILGFGFVAQTILLFVLAKFVAHAALLGEPIWQTATLLVLLLASAMAVSVAWEHRSLSYLVINAGYMAIVVFGGMSVIAFWPW